MKNVKTQNEALDTYFLALTKLEPLYMYYMKFYDYFISYQNLFLRIEKKNFGNYWKWFWRIINSKYKNFHKIDVIFFLFLFFNTFLFSIVFAPQIRCVFICSSQPFTKSLCSLALLGLNEELKGGLGGGVLQNTTWYNTSHAIQNIACDTKHHTQYNTSHVLLHSAYETKYHMCYSTFHALQYIACDTK